MQNLCGTVARVAVLAEVPVVADLHGFERGRLVAPTGPPTPLQQWLLPLVSLMRAVVPFLRAIEVKFLLSVHESAAVV